ncbi:MAG: helix-turn-helix domain-containing protein [Clostridia bacterium]|nr:helix-turn-helix domain-containing protein [Clostridia bacterium]
MNNNIEFTKFSNRLRELRKEASLSQSELAKNLNIPTSTYANWELGRTEPSIKDIYNLIKFFEIDANDLFDIDNF